MVVSVSFSVDVSVAYGVLVKDPRRLAAVRTVTLTVTVDAGCVCLSSGYFTSTRYIRAVYAYVTVETIL